MTRRALFSKGNQLVLCDAAAAVRLPASYDEIDVSGRKTQSKVDLCVYSTNNILSRAAHITSTAAVGKLWSVLSMFLEILPLPDRLYICTGIS
jgi:hypothetical protein